MEEQHVHGARAVESGCLRGKLLRMEDVADDGDKEGGSGGEGERQTGEGRKRGASKGAERGRGKQKTGKSASKKS